MRRYSTSVPNIASELFDGELVIAHYGSGLYYSISASGALIWQGLRHGLADTEVEGWLAAHYPGQEAEIASVVTSFIDRLNDEALLIPLTTDVPRGPPLPRLNGGRFEAPMIERFDDLQELLLVDPVHEVDSAGWPRRADEHAS